MDVDRNLLGARAYQPMTEEMRRQQERDQDGAPVLDFEGGNTPYVDYHSIDVLLGIQHPRTDAPGEMTFYMIGQVKELLFKLLHVEVVRARDQLLADDLPAAVWTLRRVERIQRVLLSTWDAISVLTASEFLEFRDHLGAASGFQSYMYRQLEFALGNKSPQLARTHRKVPRINEQMQAALAAPSLYDGALALLRRRGMDIPVECVERDLTQPYQAHPAVEEAWRKIYGDPTANRDLYLFAEALTEVGYNFSRWRATHLLVVERMLGDKPGTGGTAGVRWLRAVSEHRFFPELWSARSLL